MARPIQTGRNRSRVGSLAATDPVSVSAIATELSSNRARRPFRRQWPKSQPRGALASEPRAPPTDPQRQSGAPVLPTGTVVGAQHVPLSAPRTWLVICSASPVLTYHSHLAPSGSVTQVSVLVA